MTKDLFPPVWQEGSKVITLGTGLTCSGQASKTVLAAVRPPISWQLYTSTLLINLRQDINIVKEIPERRRHHVSLRHSKYLVLSRAYQHAGSIKCCGIVTDYFFHVPTPYLKVSPLSLHRAYSPCVYKHHPVLRADHTTWNSGCQQTTRPNCTAMFPRSICLKAFSYLQRADSTLSV